MENSQDSSNQLNSPAIADLGISDSSRRQDWMQSQLHAAVVPIASLSAASIFKFPVIADLVMSDSSRRQDWMQSQLHAALAPITSFSANPMQNFSVLADLAIGDSAQRTALFTKQIHAALTPIRIRAFSSSIPIFESSYVFNSKSIVSPRRVQNHSSIHSPIEAIHEPDLFWIEQELRNLLESFDRDLVPILEGVFYALASSNPDRIRHAAVSMRQLVDFVIDKLAPPSVVKAGDGRERPNREDKYKHILQTIYTKSIAVLIDHDAKSFNSLVNILSESIHKSPPTITEDQLLYALIRCQQSLLVLLQLTVYHSISKERN